jgi:hypothetical protein
MTTPRLPTATLEPVRFGEFLRDRNLISDEQWLAALADHWSARTGEKRLLGAVIVDHGFLPAEIVEAEARLFHDELDVLEVGDLDESHLPRSEKTTLPAMPMSIQALA